MAIILNSAIKVNAPKAIDVRYVIGVGQTFLDKTDIPSSERYEGLLVYILGERVRYELNGGIADNDWKLFSGYISDGSISSDLVINLNDNESRVDVPQEYVESSFMLFINGSYIRKDDYTIEYDNPSSITGGILTFSFLLEVNDELDLVKIHGATGEGSGGGGTSDHSQLTNRNLTDQHSIGAITSLQSVLDSKEPALGVPPIDGYLLSSTIAGSRIWVQGDHSKLSSLHAVDQHSIGAITDLQSELDAKIPLTQKAVANGVAPLDGAGKVPDLHLDVTEAPEDGKGYLRKDGNWTEDIPEPGPIWSEPATNNGAGINAALVESDNVYLAAAGYDISDEDVIMPAGTILKMDSGARIGGTGELRGDNTKVVLHLEKVFNDDLNITGTWDVKETHPEWFGADNTGQDDSNLAMIAAANFARLTTGKELRFSAGGYDTGANVTNGAGLIIRGDGTSQTKLYSDLAESGVGIFEASGSLGTTYSLDVDALHADNYITCAALVASGDVSIGDYVEIGDNLPVDDLQSGNEYPGEIHMIRSFVGNVIEFGNPILHKKGYTLTNSARVRKVTMSHMQVEDMTIEYLNPENDDGTRNITGLKFYYVEQPVINNVNFINVNYAAVILRGCYAADLSYTAHFADRYGLGYGLTVSGPCMFTRAAINIIGARHTVTLSALSGSWGYPHETRIYSSYLSGNQYAGGIIDMHNMPGNLYVNDSIVTGGREEYLGLLPWNPATTYAANAYAIAEDGYVVTSKSNGNTGNDPMTDVGTNWSFISLTGDGIGIRGGGGSLYFDNCEFKNLARVGYSSGATNTQDTISFTNCRTHYVNRFFQHTSGSIEKLIIKNVQMYNRHKISHSDRYALEFSSGTIGEVDIDGFSAENVRLLLLNDGYGGWVGKKEFNFKRLRTIYTDPYQTSQNVFDYTIFAIDPLSSINIDGFEAFGWPANLVYSFADEVTITNISAETYYGFIGDQRSSSGTSVTLKGKLDISIPTGTAWIYRDVGGFPVDRLHLDLEVYTPTTSLVVNHSNVPDKLTIFGNYTPDITYSGSPSVVVRNTLGKFEVTNLEADGTDVIIHGVKYPTDTPSDGDVIAFNSGAGKAEWSVGGGGGVGDMTKAVYDPNTVNGDAFDMDNMVEGATNKVLTSAERTILSNTSGVNTGDQDLSGKEDVGVAQGLMTTHTTTHPAPTNRDTRNQVAGSYEDDLGNPTTNGDILSSTTAGVRSWITPSTPTLQEVTTEGNSTTDDIETTGSVVANLIEPDATAIFGNTSFYGNQTVSLSIDQQAYMFSPTSSATLNLVAISTAGGRFFVIINAGTGTLTVARNGTDLINGGSSNLTVASNRVVWLWDSQTTGGWFTINNFSLA